ncbi:hypothetical protein ESA_01663 [Cronobacter sakazakii ATCC BAA-894]|uniref:Uncharacterized protein n=1 Tax=Cronobacter sakazakii (strain ATCC BAA-894) TaxID=290339 RepID=A7MGG6_CROS8|nr:hypothetical protein ESA_01663 [Cronobacter sakazakii ATCC BAA-894]
MPGEKRKKGEHCALLSLFNAACFMHHMCPVRTLRARCLASTAVSGATAAVTVLATFTPSFRGAFTVIFKITPALLATFMTCFRCAFWVVFKITAAVLTAFLACFRRALTILCEIT